jgi:hypothetical protein
MLLYSFLQGWGTKNVRGWFGELDAAGGPAVVVVGEEAEGVGAGADAGADAAPPGIGDVVGGLIGDRLVCAGGAHFP